MMKSPAFTTPLVTFALMLCFPAALLGGEIDLSKWQYRAALETEGRPANHVVTCRLPPKVLDLAQPDLRDLRVVLNDSSETGYVVRRSKGQTRREVYAGRMYNLTFVPGKETSVTVDFGEKYPKNGVQVDTEGTNFRRKVRVEGSDDGIDWRVVRDEGFLFRSGKDGTLAGLEKSAVEIPDNDQRYLRITVLNDTDDSGKVPIRRVTSWRQIRAPAETAPLTVAATSVKQRKKQTEIILDLGLRNVPLRTVHLNIADDNFYRTLRIQGRNSETRLVKMVVEDSPKLEKKVPVPWQHVASGTIYRFTTRSGVEESVNLGLHGAPYRYVRLVIQNRDDRPLHFQSASATMLIQNLLVEAKPGRQYSLYFGNTRARKPQYELASYVEKLKRTGVVTQGRIADVVRNPLYKVPIATIPWSERHKAIIWLALIVMLAVLGFLVWRMARSAQRMPNGS